MFFLLLVSITIKKKINILTATELKNKNKYFAKIMEKKKKIAK